MISYDIYLVDLLNHTSILINDINAYVYKVYESLEILENCTPLDEIIEYVPVPSEECLTELCTMSISIYNTR